MSSESNFTVISKNDSKCTKFLLSTFYGSNKVKNKNCKRNKILKQKVST